MTIGDIIKKYREEHSLSQRQFAQMCDISNGYISMLEKGMNPQTKEPITPSLPALKTIATAMGMSLNDLINQADDIQVNISENIDAFKKRHASNNKTDNGRMSEFIELYEQLTPKERAMIIAQIKGILANR